MNGRALVCLACLAVAAAVLAGPAAAYADEVADELADVRAELAQKTQELEALVQEISGEQDAVGKLDAEIEKTLAQLQEKQASLARLQNDAAELATVMYKDNEDFNFFVLLTESGSLPEFLRRWEMREHALSASSEMLDALRAAQDELDEAYRISSKASDEKHGLVKDLKAKREKLDDLIGDLEKREAHLDAEQKAALAQASAEKKKVAQTFETASDDAEDGKGAGADGKDAGSKDTDGKADDKAASKDEGKTDGKADEAEKSDDGASAIAPSADEGQGATAGPAPADENGWRTGMASAYGGSSDDSCPNPGTTATGTRCDDWSVGVAVPIAWGPENYYGKYVEISYGGQSIVAPIVDCGGMGGGSRALDLQPGVFKAFGAKTCDDWGVREVSYRFL